MSEVSYSEFIELINKASFIERKGSKLLFSIKITTQNVGIIKSDDSVFILDSSKGLYREDIKVGNVIEFYIKNEVVHDLYSINYFPTQNDFLSSYPDTQPTEKYYIRELEVNKDINTAIYEDQLTLYYDFRKLLISLSLSSDFSYLDEKYQLHKLGNSIAGLIPIDQKSNFLTFKKMIEDQVNKFSKHYQVITTNTIISFIKDKHYTEIAQLSNDFKEFYSQIENHYKIFINQFSFEKTYKDFLEIKNSYINSLNNYYEQIRKNVITLPLSIIISYFGLIQKNQDRSDSINSKLMDLIPFALQISITVYLLILILMSIVLTIPGLIHLREKINEEEDRFKKIGVTINPKDFSTLRNKRLSLFIFDIIIILLLSCVIIFTWYFYNLSKC